MWCSTGASIFVIYSICLIIVPAASQWSNNGCTTPDFRPGSCVDLRTCSSLLAVLNRNPLTNADRSYLLSHQCGRNGGVVFVCCPQTNPQPTQPVTPTQPPRGRFDARNLPQPGVCGNQLTDRIIGGEATKLGEFRWMALIQYSKPNNKKGFHCGGVLINENYVLTASHCVNGKDLAQLKWELSAVRLGEWDTTQDVDCEEEDNCSDPALDVPVVERIPHELYVPSSKTQENDIALLRLGRSIKFTDWIRPICLPVAQNLRSANYNDITLTVAGWGKTEAASNSDLLLKVSVKGFPLERCNSVYRVHNVVLGPTQLCAGGDKGFDSCRGDSGGPLMGLDTTDKRNPYWYLAAIVSFGPSPCGQEGWPGVYTRASSFVDWILDHMRP